MHGQDFEMVRGELLTELERLVVEEHAAVHSDLLGEPWSLSSAYRWIRYEDPDPVGRLIAASGLLADAWCEARDRPRFRAARAAFETVEARRVARALKLARSLGYPR
jgi:hypothetical protein